MIWDSWSDFFAMGGYALYVWGSIIVVAGCMFGEVASLMLRRKSILQQFGSQRRPGVKRQGACDENAA
ncbi:MAG TPA: heme exporter protein CcmD [Burkholderiaceae bacterium]|jgi:heme exporter protein D|nr:heme exporter protein CcmD [Burkholderiaceae bacterium]